LFVDVAAIDFAEWRQVGEVRALEMGVMHANVEVAMGAMNPEMQKRIEAADWRRPTLATILLVEDEAAVREVTREALEMGGFRVLEASGPEEAARIAEDPSAEIDLLLTDVVMPEMCGPDLALRVGKSRPGLLTLFMTGYAESELARAATRGILQNYIQKPFTIDGLLSEVAEALATRWRGDEEDRPPQFPSP
jgi:two-component system cell cycle sensor histidine kinase/response regulator CckA